MFVNIANFGPHPLVMLHLVYKALKHSNSTINNITKHS